MSDTFPELVEDELPEELPRRATRRQRIGYALPSMYDIEKLGRLLTWLGLGFGVGCADVWLARLIGL